MKDDFTINASLFISAALTSEGWIQTDIDSMLLLIDVAIDTSNHEDANYAEKAGKHAPINEERMGQEGKDYRGAVPQPPEF